MFLQVNRVKRRNTHNGADLVCEIANVPGIFFWLNLSFLFVLETEGGRIGCIRLNPTCMRILGSYWQMNGRGHFSHEPFSQVHLLLRRLYRRKRLL